MRNCTSQVSPFQSQSLTSCHCTFVHSSSLTIFLLINQQVSESINQPVNLLIHSTTNQSINWMDGWMDGWRMDGWMDNTAENHSFPLTLSAHTTPPSFFFSFFFCLLLSSSSPLFTLLHLTSSSPSLPHPPPSLSPFHLHTTLGIGERE